MSSPGGVCREGCVLQGRCEVRGERASAMERRLHAMASEVSQAACRMPRALPWWAARRGSRTRDVASRPRKGTDASSLDSYPGNAARAHTTPRSLVIVPLRSRSRSRTRTLVMGGKTGQGGADDVPAAAPLKDGKALKPAPAGISTATSSALAIGIGICVVGSVFKMGGGELFEGITQ